MTSVCGLLTWWGICLTSTRFYAGLKAQGIDRKMLPYRAPFQPFLAYYGLIFCTYTLTVHQVNLRERRKERWR